MLKGAPTKIVQSEETKFQEKKFVDDFLTGQLGAKPADVHTSAVKPVTHNVPMPMSSGVESAKFRLAFDPPEDTSRRPIPEALDLTSKANMLHRAEMIVHKASNISVREATSLEQRKQKEEAAYTVFEDLHNQNQEIYEMKRKMEADQKDSNFTSIQTLLFGPRPDDPSALGDWDTYEKVQQVIKRFVYNRFTPETGLGEEPVHVLQERLNKNRETMEVQRVRIRDLTHSLQSSNAEIAGLKALLAEKNNELAHMRSKESVLQTQLKHARSAAPPAEAKGDEGKRNGSPDLLVDFQNMFAANLMLEQENIQLRAKLCAKGIDATTDVSHCVVPSVAELATSEARRSLIKQTMPTTSAVLQLRRSRAAWRLRIEASECATLSAYDNDANVELVKKPQVDLSRLVQKLQKNTALPTPRGSAHGEPPSSFPSTQDGAPSHRLGAHSQQTPPPSRRSQTTPAERRGGGDHHEARTGHQSPQHSSEAGWMILKTRALASVAISRADCLRREAMHVRKLRHRVAKLSEDLSICASDRDLAVINSGKVEQELADTKVLVSDLSTRLEVVTRAAEEAERDRERLLHLPQLGEHRTVAAVDDAAASSQETDKSGTQPATKRLQAIVKRMESRRVQSHHATAQESDKDVQDLVGYYQSLNRQLEAKISSLNEIFSTKVEDLEADLAEAKRELQVANSKMIRDGIFYDSRATPAAAVASHTTHQDPAPKGSSTLKPVRRQVEGIFGVGEGDQRLKSLHHGQEDDATAVSTNPPETLNPSAEAARAVDSSQPSEDSQELRRKVHKLEHDLREREASARIQDRVCKTLETELRILKDTASESKAMKEFGFTDRVAARIVPKMRAWLYRCRRQPKKVRRMSDADGLPIVDDGQEDEEAQIIDQMMQLVGQNSPAKGIILKQKMSSVPAAPAEQAIATSLLSSLRVQWLQLLRHREELVQSSSNGPERKKLLDRLRQTYEDFVECEYIVSATRGEERVCSSGKSLSSAAHLTTDPDLSDIRSSEQLERQHMAQEELKRALIQLSRDIEVKRSELLSTDTSLQVAAPRSAQVAKPCLFFKHVSTGTETIADVYARYGHTHYDFADAWSRHHESVLTNALLRETVWVPIRHAMTARAAEAAVSAQFVVRYAVQQWDSLASIRSRFGVSDADIMCPHDPDTMLTSASTLPPAVDVLVPYETAVQHLRMGITSSLVFAKVTANETQMSTLGRMFNVDRYLLLLFNSPIKKQSVLHVPCQISPHNTSFVMRSCYHGEVVLQHHVHKGETIASIARRYSVEKTDIVGAVSVNETLDITLRNPDLLKAIAPHPMLFAFDGLETVTIEKKINLEELARAHKVCPFEVLLPNLDLPLASLGACTACVRAERLEQLEFALQHRLRIVSWNEESIVSYTDLGSLMEALKKVSHIYILLPLSTWNREEACRQLNVRDPFTLGLWNATLDPAIVPTVAIRKGAAPDRHYVRFEVTHDVLKQASMSPECLRDAIAAICQDYLEAFSYACAEGSVLHCEVPFVTPKDVFHVTACFLTAVSATAAVHFLAKDAGRVQHTHVLNALRSHGKKAPDSMPLMTVDPKTGVNVSSGYSAATSHTVSVTDTLQTVALRHGISIDALKAANASSILRAASTIEVRRTRRKIVIEDTDSAPAGGAAGDSIETLPLHKAKVSVMIIPKPHPLKEIHFSALDSSTSISHIASNLGSESAKLYFQDSLLSVNVGSVLRLPTRATRKYVTTTGGPVLSDTSVFVVEGRGDTIESASIAFQIPARTIALWNASSSKLLEGAVVAYEASSSFSPTFIASHRTRDEDTFHSICDLYNVAPQTLLEANPQLRCAEGSEALLVPVTNDRDEMLNCSVKNLFTIIPEVAVASIAKLFSCPLQLVTMVNEYCTIPGKKIAPVMSASAMSFARRQNLSLYVLTGVAPSETLVTIASRMNAHISDFVKLGKPLSAFTDLIRIPVSSETARRVTENARLSLENINAGMYPMQTKLLAPNVIEVLSVSDVDYIAQAVQNEVYKRNRFAQRVKFFDERLEAVAERIAALQVDITAVDGAIQKQKDNGTFATVVVSVNRDDVAVQTDPIVFEIPKQDVIRRIIPTDFKTVQTDLSGEAIESIQWESADAQGKVNLLESELAEARKSRNQVAGTEAQAHTLVSELEDKNAKLVRQLKQSAVELQQLKVLLREQVELARSTALPTNPSSGLASPIELSLVDKSPSTYAIRSPTDSSPRGDAQRQSSFLAPANAAAAAGPLGSRSPQTGSAIFRSKSIISNERPIVFTAEFACQTDSDVGQANTVAARKVVFTRVTQTEEAWPAGGFETASVRKGSVTAIDTKNGSPTNIAKPRGSLTQTTPIAQSTTSNNNNNNGNSSGSGINAPGSLPSTDSRGQPAQSIHASQPVVSSSQAAAAATAAPPRRSVGSLVDAAPRFQAANAVKQIAQQQLEMKAFCFNIRNYALQSIHQLHSTLHEQLKQLLSIIANLSIPSEVRIVEQVRVITEQMSNSIQAAVIQEKLRVPTQGQATDRTGSGNSTARQDKPLNDKEWAAQNISAHVVDAIKNSTPLHARTPLTAGLDPPRLTENEAAVPGKPTQHRPSPGQQLLHVTTAQSTGQAATTTGKKPFSLVSTASTPQSVALHVNSQTTDNLSTRPRSQTTSTHTNPTLTPSLPPLPQSAPKTPPPLPMRTATAKLLASHFEVHKPKPLPVEPKPPAASPARVDVRSRDHLKEKKHELERKLLNLDTQRAMTPPFSPEYSPAAGDAVGVHIVSNAAQQQLRYIRDKVHREVLAALHMNFGDDSGNTSVAQSPFGGTVSTAMRRAMPAMRVVRELNDTNGTPLDEGQLQAVQRIRDEVEELRKMKRNMLLQRVATRLRTRHIVSKISHHSSPHSAGLIMRLWNRWLEKWNARRHQATAAEKFKMQELLGLFSGPTQNEENAEPNVFIDSFRYTAYNGPTPVAYKQHRKMERMEIGATQFVGINSSTHFRLAKFE